MKVHISEHFTYKKIFLITIFPIVMMVFTSLYWIVDGICTSNFAGASSFAAVNLAFPFISIIGAIGFMFGTGGTALVSKLLGEKKDEEANQTFSLIVYSTIVLGVIIAIIFYFLVEPIMVAMGNISETATDDMVREAIKYGKILALAQPVFMLQYLFHAFLMVAEKPRLGFIFTIASGISNMILDVLLVGLARWGVVGAAIATIVGYSIGGFGPLIYFFVKRDGVISLGKPNLKFGNVLRSAYNGMSEFIANIAMSVVSIVYNAQLLKAYGENGVSAYGVIMYVSFVFFAIFIGYALGIAPVVGYNYGAQNKEELHNVFRKSVFIIAITSLIMFALSFASARPFARIFSGGSDGLLSLSTTVLRIYSFAFIFCGIGSFASSFFTALNNGTVSATISISRTLVFQILFVFILPLIFGPIGIWWAIVVGEALSTLLSLIFLITLRKKYGY